MVTRFQVSVIAFVLSMILSASSALAGIGLDFVGAGTFPMAKGSVADPTGKFSPAGGGLLFSFGGMRFRVELGGTYLTRVYTIDTDQTTRLLKGSLGFKFALFRSVELVLGGFYNRIFTSDIGLTGTDAGLMGGLNLKIPLGSKVAILLSPRYNYALNAMTTTGGYTITPHEVVGLVGLSFGGRMGK